MEFSEKQAIYLQIADKICESVLTREWKENQRIPSVREIAVLMEVNPNTANRAYDFLQNEGIIYNKRGIGYFVAENGFEKTMELKRTEFLQKELPQFYKTMQLLGLTWEDVNKELNNLKW